MTLTPDFTYTTVVDAEKARARLGRPPVIVDGLGFFEFGEWGDSFRDVVSTSLVVVTDDWEAVAAVLPTYGYVTGEDFDEVPVTDDCVRWVQVRESRLAGLDDFVGTAYRTVLDDGRPVTAADEGAIRVVCIPTYEASAGD